MDDSCRFNAVKLVMAESFCAVVVEFTGICTGVPSVSKRS